jgi:hypothetical protein
MGRMTLVMMLLLLMLAGCSSAAKSAAGSVISLRAADILHDRLREECGRIGYAVLYRGALSYSGTPGFLPVFDTGQWDIVPKNALPDPRRPSAPLRTKDLALTLQIVDSQAHAGQLFAMTVAGERIWVDAGGRPPSWRFPGTQTSVADLLNSCSDGLTPRESRGNTTSIVPKEPDSCVPSSPPEVNRDSTSTKVSPFAIVDEYLTFLTLDEEKRWWDSVRSRGFQATMSGIEIPGHWESPLTNVYGIRTPQGAMDGFQYQEFVSRGSRIIEALRELAGSPISD